MLNVLHQHTHTNLVPDPAVGLEPRADNDGPAIPLTCTRWDRVWSWVPSPPKADWGLQACITALSVQLACKRQPCRFRGHVCRRVIYGSGLGYARR